MSGTAPGPGRPRPALPLTVRDRALAWIVIGPVGRVVAFFADVAAYWWRWARGRTAERGER